MMIYDDGTSVLSRISNNSLSLCAIRCTNPSIKEVGDPCNLNNYLPDSGVIQHMTPCLQDLIKVVEGQCLGIKAPGGHIIKCSTTCGVLIKMQDDNREEFSATLKDIQNNGIVLYF